MRDPPAPVPRGSFGVLLAQLFVQQLADIAPVRGRTRGALDRVVYAGVDPEHRQTIRQIVEFMVWASEIAFRREYASETPLQCWERMYVAIQERFGATGGPIPRVRAHVALHTAWSQAPVDETYENADWMLIDAAMVNYTRIVERLPEWELHVAERPG